MAASGRAFNASLFIPSDAGAGAGSALGQCRSKDLPVFSRDLPGRKGAKTFFACGYNYFVTKYYKRQATSSSKSPSCYEVIDYDHACRVFIDIDYAIGAGPSPSLEQTKETLTAFKEHLLDRCVKIFELPSRPRMVILTGTTKVKFSEHIILHVCVANVGLVGELVRDTIESFGGDGDTLRAIVDTSIYTKNRSFRIAYSCKWGKPEGRLVPINDHYEQPYDPSLLYDSLVQALRPGDVVHSKLPSSKSRVSRSLGSSDAVGCSKSDFPVGLLEHVLKPFCGADVEISTTRVFPDSGTMQCVLLKAPCPWRKNGTVHKSNNQFFSYTIGSKFAWLRCSDTSCPSVRYGRIDVRFALEE